MSNAGVDRDQERVRLRSGQYIRQPSGYRAFLPAPFPPSPPIELDAELTRSLSLADRALGRLDGSALTLTNPDLFILMYVKKEAVLSSQIEGTQSSLQDLLSAEALVFDPQRPRDVDEVVNYVAAMKYGLKRLEELPVSIRLVREIHEKLLQDVRGSHLSPGELRKSQNWIGPAGSSINSASFVPPPPHELLQHLGMWETFLHSEEDLPPLLKIALAHAQFETLHPFLDGNGRVGRLMITFLLTQSGILHQPVLYLSHYFKKNRQEYYEHLQAVRDRGEWEEWCAFFLRGVKEVADEAAETTKNILLLRETHRDLILQKFDRLAGNALRVLQLLYDRPVVSIADVEKLLEVSHTAASAVVYKMAEHRILEEITGYARNRRYLYNSYVRLFD